MYTTKSGNEGPTCALLFCQNIVQNYCNKSSFCYLCLTSSCSGNTLNNNQISMWIGWDRRVGRVFFFSKETVSHQTLNYLVNEIEDKNIHFDQKKELKTDLKCTILFCTLWKTLRSERLIKNTVASL